MLEYTENDEEHPNPGSEKVNGVLEMLCLILVGTTIAVPQIHMNIEVQ